MLLKVLWESLKEVSVAFLFVFTMVVLMCSGLALMFKFLSVFSGWWLLLGICLLTFLVVFVVSVLEKLID